MESVLRSLPPELPAPVASRESRKYRYLEFESVADAAVALAAIRDQGFADVSFDTPVEVPAECSETVPPALKGAGLRLIHDFISPGEEQALTQAIDASEWDTSIHRRTQHYGTRFDYKLKSFDMDGGAPSFPEWLTPFIERLLKSGAVPWHDRPDQVTVNEYLPGMGIASHIDTHSAFEDGIAALSLGSGCAMRLSCMSDDTGSHSHVNLTSVGALGITGATLSKDTSATLWLPPRSLIVFCGATRYAWAHAIPMRKGDVIAGRGWTPRGRRISITCRRILRLPHGCQCHFPQLCESQGGLSIALPTRMRTMATAISHDEEQ